MPINSTTALVVVIVIVIAVVIAMSFWWLFPKFQLKTLGYIPDHREKAKLENEFRNTVAQPISAFLLLAGVLGAYYQVLVTAQNSADDYDAKQHSSALALMTGNSLLERMAGIELLKDWANRELPDVEQNKRKKFLRTVLRGYLRSRQEYKLVFTEYRCGDKPEEYAPWAKDKNLKMNEERQLGKIESDAQAVLNVLFENTAEQELDLSKLWLRGANIRKAKGVSINFSFSDLSMADFTGSILEDPDFFCTNLSSTQFEDTQLLGSSVGTPGKQVNMVGVVASNAKFNGATLRHVNLNDAGLKWVEANNSTWTDIEAIKANFGGFDFALPRKVDGVFTDACLFEAKNWNKISSSTQNAITEKGDPRQAVCR